MLRAAMEAVEAESNVKSACRCFEIPPSSLRDHLYGRTVGRKRGRGGVLTTFEEADLEAYVLKMQDLGWPLTVGQLRLKVAEIVQDRVNPFTNGILGAGWLRWFRRRHPTLTLRSTQGLEVNRARNFCPENVATFYHNLQTLYVQHAYAPDHIWNCDESGAQAGRNGGGTWVKISSFNHSRSKEMVECPFLCKCCRWTHSTFLHFQGQTHEAKLH